MLRSYAFTVPIGPGHHNRLPHTLESLAAQSVKVRVAICHAGPRDEIADIIAPYQHIIAYEQHRPDGGQSDAINQGWQAVGGDVYGWLNTDDALAPGALEKVDSVFDAAPDADIVCGQSLITDDNDRFTGLHPAVKRPDSDLFRSNIISQPSCFVKRDALFEVSLVRPDLHYAMDWDLWVRLMEAGKQFAYTDQVLSSVLWTADTKTASISKARMSEIRGVVARQGSPVTTLKTLIGFTLHHLAEYSFLSSPIKSLCGLINHGPYGVPSYWGPPDASSLNLDLFHYPIATSSSLQIDFNRTGNWRIGLDGVEQTYTNTNRATIDLISSSAKCVNLTIKDSSFSPSDIKTIVFLD